MLWESRQPLRVGKVQLRRRSERLQQKQSAVAKALNLNNTKVLTKPDYSYVANAILTAYNTIARSRRYEQGVPLALDISAINAYVEQYDLPVERYIFNDCIFTLDDMFWMKRIRRRRNERRRLKC